MPRNPSLPRSSVKDYTIKRSRKRTRKPLSLAASAAASSDIIGSSFTAVEVKFFDFGIANNTSIAACHEMPGATQLDPFSVNPPQFQCVNMIAAGDDDNQRTGKRINLKNIRIRGEFSIPTSNTTAPSTRCRAVLVYDKSNNEQAAQSGPLLRDIFALSSTVGSATNVSSLSNTLVSSRSRFTILRDENITLGPWVAPSFGAPTVHSWDWYISLKGLQSQYSSTSAGIPYNGGLYMIVLGDEPSAANGNFACTYSSRIRFSDP